MIGFPALPALAGCQGKLFQRRSFFLFCEAGIEGVGCEDFCDSFNGWEAVEKGRDFFDGFIGGLAFADDSRDSRVALAEAPRDLRG